MKIVLLILVLIMALAGFLYYILGASGLSLLSVPVSFISDGKDTKAVPLQGGMIIAEDTEPVQ